MIHSVQFDKEISLVSQAKDSNDCVLACVAMLTGKSIEELRGQLPEETDHESGYSSFEEEFLLLTNKIYSVTLTPSWILYGAVYLVSVPSKNQERALHRIVLDCRDPDNLICFDPQTGNVDENKLYTGNEVIFDTCYCEVKLIAGVDK
jgi:hypothetical protein